MSGPSRGMRATVAVVATLAIAFVIPFLSSTNVSAVGTLTVYGYVTDQAGRPIGGIPVVAVTMNGSTLVNTTHTTTMEDGFYTVTFGGLGEWDIGNKVIVAAQSGGDQAWSEFVITEEIPFLQLDVKFPYEIPQFGTLVGFLVAAAAVGTLATLFLVKRSRRSGH